MAKLRSLRVSSLSVLAAALAAVALPAQTPEGLRLVDVIPLPGGAYDLAPVPDAEGGARLLVSAYQDGRLQYVGQSAQGFSAPVRAQYFPSRDLSGAAVTQTERQILFPWGEAAPAEGLPANDFSCRWTARVRPAFNEDYEFYTVSDDGVRLWIDGQLVIDQWRPMGATEFKARLSLRAGREVEIKMEHFDQGGAAYAELGWSSPSTPKAPIQMSGRLSTALLAAQNRGFVGGVQAEYFAGTNFQRPLHSRKESSIYYPAGDTSPAPDVPKDQFSVRWTGKLRVDASGTYRFYTTSDDGIRLWLDDASLIDQWRGMAATEFSAEARLEAGQEYSLRMEYFEQGGGGTARLEWASETMSRRLIGVLGATTLADSSFETPPYAAALTVGDWNKDGRSDAAVVHLGFPGYLTTLLADGAGRLIRAAPIRVGNDPSAIARGDIDADGDLDLIVAARSSTAFVVLSNDGAGSFAAQPVTASAGALGLAMGPVYGDSADVLLFGSRAEVTPYRNDGRGRIQRQSAVQIGMPVSACQGLDWNQDRRLDFACGNEAGSVLVFLNRNGEFQQTQTIALGKAVRSLSIIAGGRGPALLAGHAESAVLLLPRGDGAERIAVDGLPRAPRACTAAGRQAQGNQALTTIVCTQESDSGFLVLQSDRL